MWTAKPEISKAEPKVIKKLIINQLHTRPQQPSLNSELLTHQSHTSKGLRWHFLVPFPKSWWEHPVFQDLHVAMSEQVNTEL